MLTQVSSSERRGNNLNGLKDFYMNAKARIWPRLSYVCHIRSTEDHHTFPPHGGLVSGPGRGIRSHPGNLFFSQNLATKITTQFGFTSNIKAFVRQFSLPNSERYMDFPGLAQPHKMCFFCDCVPGKSISFRIQLF